MRFAQIISDQLKNRDNAYQFCLEELDGASKGNDKSIKFALNSGVAPKEYAGAMKNHVEEISGPGGSQNFLNEVTLALLPDRDLMSEFRILITQNIMKLHGFGKY